MGLFHFQIVPLRESKLSVRESFLAQLGKRKFFAAKNIRAANFT